VRRPPAGRLAFRNRTRTRRRIAGKALRPDPSEWFLNSTHRRLSQLFEDDPDLTITRQRVYEASEHSNARAILNMLLPRKDIPSALEKLYWLLRPKEFYRRDITFDVDKVKQAFSDSSIGIHFLYFTQPAATIPGIYMQEQSEDIYSAFTEMAEATGGLATSSANPEFLFQKASDASENYYLLYYTPQGYEADGKFKNIQVKVKGRSYRITHRAGYFAD